MAWSANSTAENGKAGVRMEFATTLESPVGELVLVSDGTSLTGILFDARSGAGRRRASRVADDDAPPFPQARRELAEYFAGRRREFEVPLAPRGTPFQLRVWEALRRIPHGATATYRDVARAIGAPAAVRAVGAANARNPLPIIVPCHRVIRSDGALGGYGGGLKRKQELLRLEAGSGRVPQRQSGL